MTDVNDTGVPVALRGGRVVNFFALSWAAMKRTRAQRAVIFSQDANPLSPEWEDAVLDVLYESATAGGDDITKDEFSRILTPQYTKKCFEAMTHAGRVSEEVAEDGAPRPTKSLNGTGSTPTSSHAQDGIGGQSTS